MKDQILESYKKNKKTYHDFRERVVNLLTDLLAVQEINIHNIGGRTKTIDSLLKKIDDKGEKYSIIEDITDIVGIRIITYMESDVDSIAELIEKEFIKDVENSIDKRKLKADQFGYRSLHIVASLGEDRCGLKEYKKYKGIKCEIQVRSILQHAWAEIEHDLGYKGEVSIPESYKRTFNRLSALLETADIEFDRLKSQLKEYEREVPQLIRSKPQSVDINKASISSFIYTNSVLLAAKNIIVGLATCDFTDSEINDYNIKVIKHFKFKSIDSLEKALSNEKKDYLNFVIVLVKNKVKPNRTLKSTAPLMFFFHFLAAKSQDEKIMEDYFTISNFKIDENVMDYINFYKEAVSLNNPNIKT